MAEYKIQISSKAQRDFKKLDPKVQKIITVKILALKNKRRPQQFKFLSNFDVAQFRLRVGDYRVLYDVYDQDKTVLIIRIGHRKEVYRS
jgi:mRNA interferase RelE/StbE